MSKTLIFDGITVLIRREETIDKLAGDYLK